MIDSQRVTKKLKIEPKCIELFLKLDKSVSMYLLNIDDRRYILLDRFWCFIREYDSNPVEMISMCVCYYEHSNPPEIAFVRKAKEILDTDIFDCLIQCYQSHAPYTWKYSILPVEEISITNLILIYDHDPNDYLLYVLFSYLRKQKHTKPIYISGSRFFFNNMVRVITWKGYVKWHPYHNQYHVLNHLVNKEDESLLLLAMARNRPAKDNFFAQMNKDVLFKEIFPLIKWSLPFCV